MVDNNTIWKNTNEAANFIKRKCEFLENFNPLFGIICGAGLANISEILDGDDENQKSKQIVIPFNVIPHFEVICFQGRMYQFENCPSWKVALPIRIIKLFNIESIFITDTVVPICKELQSGNIMIVKDHINLVDSFNKNILCGFQDDRWGLQSIDMKFAYDTYLRVLAKSSVKNLKLEKYVKEGTYVMIYGPFFQTFAEETVFNKFGGHVLGHVIPTETLIARQSRLSVCALSFVTADYLDPITAFSRAENKIERADSHVIDSDDELTTSSSLDKYNDENSLATATSQIRKSSNIDEQAMLALSVDDGSRRIGQIIKEIIIRKILS